MTFGVILKRLRRQPFTASELRAPVHELIDDLSWAGRSVPQCADYIESATFSDGQRFDAHWKKGMSALIEAASSKTTWLEQRTELLGHCVNAASWIAAVKVILPEYESAPELWSDIVSGVDVFEKNPPEHWATVLFNGFVQNTLIATVLPVITTVCFGVPSRYSATIGVYERLRAASDVMRISMSGKVHGLAYDEPHEREFFVQKFQKLALPVWESVDGFFKRLAEDIIMMRSIKGYENEWERLSNSHNEQMQRILTDLRASSEPKRGS